MKKEKNNTVFQLIHKFQQNVIDRKPSLSVMLEDMRMMQFKIRPITGDLSLLNFKNNQFIEVLWSLGKLDEFYHVAVSQLSKKDQQVFQTYIQSMHTGLQSQLHTIGLKNSGKNTSQVFEVEIFKERNKNNYN